MSRHYLEEDLELIQHYFPGAKAISLRTPFDLTARTPTPKLRPDQFRDDEPTGHWYGDLLWNH